MFQPQAPTELAAVHRKSHFMAWVRLRSPCHDALQTRGLFIEGTVFGFIDSITNAGHWPHVVQSMFVSTCSVIVTEVFLLQSISQSTEVHPACNNWQVCLSIACLFSSVREVFKCSLPFVNRSSRDYKSCREGTSSRMRTAA